MVEFRLIASERSQLFTSFSDEEPVLFASLFTLISKVIGGILFIFILLFLGVAKLN